MSDDHDSRRSRLQLLSRTNRVRVAASGLLADLAQVLGEPVAESALLPPLQSDEIITRLNTGYQGAIRSEDGSYRRLFQLDERNLVFELADHLADKLNEEPTFLTIKLGRDRLAVLLNISTLLRHTASILRLDGDSLSAISKDLTQGILIDQNLDDVDQAYEVALWGDRWPLLTSL